MRDRTSSTTHRCQCGDPLFEDDLQDPDLRQLKETFFIREAQSCHDPVEADFFNTGGTAVRHCASILACVPSASRLPLPAAHLHYLLHQGRAEFEYICSECGADPEQSPLVSDAVLGLHDGKKLRRS